MELETVTMKNGQSDGSLSKENKLKQQETNEENTKGYNDRAFIRENIPSFSHNGLPEYFRTVDVLLYPSLYVHIINSLKRLIKKNSPSIDCLASIASRGHLYGPTLAAILKLPLVCIQKAGKLPGPILQADYSMVYSKSQCLEIAYDPIIEQSINGKHVAILDDCIATGGTMVASAQLIERANGTVVACITPFNDNRHGRSEEFQEKLQPMLKTLYDFKAE